MAVIRPIGSSAGIVDHVDDGPGLVRAFEGEMLSRVMDQHEWGFRVDHPHATGRIRIHLAQFQSLEDRGIVDQNVESARTLHDRFDEGASVLIFSQIPANDEGFTTRTIDRLDQILGRGQASVAMHGDDRTRGRECSADLSADAHRTPRHQCDAVLQRVAHGECKPSIHLEITVGKSPWA